MLVSKKQAASYLGISIGLLDRLVRQGAIKAVRIGRRVLFKSDTLEKFTGAEFQTELVAKPRRKFEVN
jgi:excisionase family DNA binding protein